MWGLSGIGAGHFALIPQSRFATSSRSPKDPGGLVRVSCLSKALVTAFVSIGTTLPRACLYVFAGHLSVEPGARIALDMLQKKPLLSLDMRLGEGSGGALVIPILQSAARLLAEMASFEEAGVKEA